MLSRAKKTPKQTSLSFRLFQFVHMILVLLHDMFRFCVVLGCNYVLFLVFFISQEK